MKLEFLDEDDYKVFINSCYIKDININHKEELSRYVKTIILKLRKIYDLVLEGFYEVHVYSIGHIGIILEIHNIDNFISKTIDLKIIVHNDEKYYLKIKNYDLVKHFKELNYYNNDFYISVDKIDDKDIINLIESMEIVYASSLKGIRNKWYYLTF